jgi:hypothetical protein
MNAERFLRNIRTVVLITIILGLAAGIVYGITMLDANVKAASAANNLSMIKTDTSGIITLKDSVRKAGSDQRPVQFYHHLADDMIAVDKIIAALRADGWNHLTITPAISLHEHNNYLVTADKF